MSFRLSYNDIKLFLAIAQSLPNLESKEPRSDSLKKYQKEIKGKCRHEWKKIISFGILAFCRLVCLFVSDQIT